jgi:hypothetical protein
MGERKNSKKKYLFKLDPEDFEKIRELAVRDTEGNIAFFIRKLLKEELKKNSSFFKKRKSTHE